MAHRSWHIKRTLLANPPFGTQLAASTYLSHHAETILAALQRCREGWPASLTDYDPSQRSPSLYQDRADATWYLAGILTLPNIPIVAPRCPPVESADHNLSIGQLLERVMVLCDRHRLDRATHDFATVHRMVMELQESDLDSSPPSQLIYREPDSTTTGFAD